MYDVALYEAKNRLSELINRVQSGEEIAITKHGKVVARLVPAQADATDRRALDAIAGLRACRMGVKVGNVHSRDLVREGRRCRQKASPGVSSSMPRSLRLGS